MNHYEIHRGKNRHLVFFFRLVIFLSFVLVVGLGWRQLIRNEEHELLKKRQMERRVLRPGIRGNIYDRKGNLLVGNRPHHSVAVYLDDLRPEFRSEYSKVIRAERKRLRAAYEQTSQNIRDEKDLVPDHNELQWVARENVIQRYMDKINAITGRNDRLSRKEIIRHFNERLLLPLILVKDLSIEAYACLIECLPVQCPIQIHTDAVRYYPYGPAAAHTLGYVQKVNLSPEEIPDDGMKTFIFKTKQGKSGLEYAFDKFLSGQTGTEIWRVDPLGFQDALLESKSPRQGSHLITSIDIDIQLAAERSLGERTGAAVALDVQTGEVLAIASRPSYDLNDWSPYISRTTFDEFNRRKLWLNRSHQLSYPPGSTFKLLTTIAGLKKGSIGPETRHNCQAVFPVGNRIFRCHAGHGHGVVDPVAAIEGSCNVFYYAESLNMGIDVLSAEARRFGLDRRTGIEIPFECKDIIVPTREWKEQKIGRRWVAGDTANVGIGQGFLLVTPLQMATFIASIARNETRTQPTLKALAEEEIWAIDHRGEAIGLTEVQRALLWEGMERVVGPNGTGRLIQIRDFRIAGKTGTADFRANGENLNLAWFIGFAPVENPRIALTVMVEGRSRDDRYHGGSTAGPVARDIFLEFIKQYPERAGYLPVQ